jgi:drug/metabolite transporter (DMT)-like permease
VHPRRLGLLLGFLAYASWGLLAPVGKHLIDDGAWQPLGLNAVRFALATVPVLLFLGIRGTRDSLKLLAKPRILVPNVLANLSLTFFLYSLPAVAEPTHATLGFFAAPLLTVLLAALVLRERLGVSFAPAAVGFVAGGYLALFGLRLPDDLHAAGLVLAVLSAALWAAYAVMLRRAAPDTPVRPLVGAAFLAGTAWFGILALVIEGVPRLDVPASAWGWMALYVAVPTLASFAFFNASLRLAPAGEVNLLVGAELAFTALFSAALFGERFDAWQLGGLALVLASVTLYLYDRERRAQGPV